LTCLDALRIAAKGAALSAYFAEFMPSFGRMSLGLLCLVFCELTEVVTLTYVAAFDIRLTRDSSRRHSDEGGIPVRRILAEGDSSFVGMTMARSVCQEKVAGQLGLCRNNCANGVSRIMQTSHHVL
jgi:hypothetical protein